MLTAVAVLFLLAAGADVGVWIYVRHEVETMTRERPPPIPTPPLVPWHKGMSTTAWLREQLYDPEFLQKQVALNKSWEETATKLEESDAVDDKSRLPYQLHL